ncbi:MAG: hypothetical protein KIT18_15050 [Burkholderiales bacterium]|nr:hypothetical protein [Burkholderiales bacterium]
MTTMVSGAMPAAGARGGLLWSDYLYLLAATVAAVAVVNPLGWDVLRNWPPLRHLAIMLSACAVFMAVTGRQISMPLQRQQHGWQVMRVTWPLLALAMLIMGGALHARFITGIQNTFFVTGFYMTATACAAMMMLKTDAPDKLVRGYFRILAVAAAVMGIYLIANFGVRQVYHEQIFLVIPMAAFFLARPGRGVTDWLACAFFLSMAWFSPKYTSYLIGSLTLIYLALAVVLPRLRPRSGLYRVTVMYWLLMAVCAVAAALVYLARRGGVDLPTGNPEYRLHTYQAAWERFGESPLWGTLFSAEAVEKFTLYSIGIAGNVLPTHSDILDLLAHGGMIALLLWFLGLTRIMRCSFRNILHPGFLDHPWAPYAHTLALMSVAGVVTYAFNPILLQPPMAYLLWTNLGLLLGLALRAGTLRAGR